MKKRKGFTLVELLIVMAVIAALIAIAIPSFRGMQNEARQTRASSDLHVLRLAIESYAKNNNGQFPAVAGYQTTLQAGTPILDRTLNDPFAAANTQYVYALGDPAPANARYFVVYSVGTGGNGTATVNNGTGVVTVTNGAFWDGNGHL